MKRIFTLFRADHSGVFAIPEGLSVEQLEEVFVDGEQADFTPVKKGTEVDIPAAKENSTVTGLFKQ